MARLNYTNRLENLQKRRFDEDLQKSIISESFNKSEYPNNIKYMVESMMPIDQKYNDKTLVAAERVQSHLTDGYKLHFNVAYRKQGSVMTGTNIKVHSDFDLLTIIDRYHYTQGAPKSPYTETDPNDDIKELRSQSVKILKSIYDEVDDTGEKNISIINKSLRRKVDVVFAYWYNSDKYEQEKNEYYRGIYLYKFPHGPKNSQVDYPFAHIANVNYKGKETSDGSKRGIRLLKTLRADCETNLELLKSFQLTTIVHNIKNTDLLYNRGGELNIARAISAEMGLIIDNPVYRKAIVSPNGVENPFTDDNIVKDVKILKSDLDELIEDCSKEILGSVVIQKAIQTY